MVLATTERCGGGNLQKLNYGSFGKPLSSSVYDIRRKRFLHSAATFPFCPRSQTAVVAEMFKNLTMDLPERLPALHDNTFFVLGDKGGRVQELNYGCPGKASCA